MNSRFGFLAIVAAAAAVSGSAQATTVDFPMSGGGDGTSVNMSPTGTDSALTAGQTGTITSSTIPGLDTATGYLAPETSITFTYDLSAFGSTPAFLVDNASYGYTKGNNTFSGSASAASNGAQTAVGTKNNASSTPLVFATANIDNATHTGTLTITDVSSDAKGFAQFAVDLLLLGNSFNTPYSYTYSVSSVPLPGSALLFGLGLAMVAGFSMKRKQQA